MGGGQVVVIEPLPNNEVIVGGTITQVQGPINLQHIARYNFNTGVWSSMNSQMLLSGTTSPTWRWRRTGR